MASIIPLPLLKFRAHECGVHARPCPFRSCRMHLERDEGIQSRGSTGKQHADRLERRRMVTETCALDVADEGPKSAKEVGALLGLAGERVRQVELKALARLKRKIDWFGEGGSDE